MSRLSCFKLTDTAGESWLVNMAAGISILEATEYFLGYVRIIEDFETGIETRLPAVAKIEEVK